MSSKSRPTSKANQQEEDAIKKDMVVILEDAQRSEATHQSRLSQLIRLYSRDSKIFQRLFKEQLNKILIVLKREPSIERLIKFIVKFATVNNVKKYNNLNISNKRVTPKRSEKFKSFNEDDEQEIDSEDDSKTKKKKSKLKKDEEYNTGENQDEDEGENFDQINKKVSMTSFLDFLLCYLLSLTDAQDNAVRFRSTQIISNCVVELEDLE